MTKAQLLGAFVVPALVVQLLLAPATSLKADVARDECIFDSPVQFLQQELLLTKEDVFGKVAREAREAVDLATALNEQDAFMSDEAEEPHSREQPPPAIDSTESMIFAARPNTSGDSSVAAQRAAGRLRKVASNTSNGSAHGPSARKVVSEVVSETVRDSKKFHIPSKDNVIEFKDDANKMMVLAAGTIFTSVVGACLCGASLALIGNTIREARADQHDDNEFLGVRNRRRSFCFGCCNINVTTMLFCMGAIIFSILGMYILWTTHTIQAVFKEMVVYLYLMLIAAACICAGVIELYSDINFLSDNAAVMGSSIVKFEKYIQSTFPGMGGDGEKSAVGKAATKAYNRWGNFSVGFDQVVENVISGNIFTRPSTAPAVPATGATATGSNAASIAATNVATGAHAATSGGAASSTMPIGQATPSGGMGAGLGVSGGAK